MNPQDENPAPELEATPPPVPAALDRLHSRRGITLGAAITGLAVLAAACTDDSAGPGGTAGATSTTAGGTGTTAPSASSTTAGAGASTTTAGEAETTTNEEPSVISAAEGEVEGGRDPNNPTADKPSAELAQDLPTAAFAAGLEVLAVNAYKRAAAAAKAGSLGDVPPSVSDFITTVTGHHQAVLDQWNRALAISGEPQVSEPDAVLQPTVDAAFARITDVVGAARLALMLEEIASATYLAAIPTLKSPEAIGLAASVQPVDMQHAAVLHFVLGEYPVPDVFGKVDKAASPA